MKRRVTKKVRRMRRMVVLATIVEEEYVILEVCRAIARPVVVDDVGGLVC